MVKKVKVKPKTKRLEIQSEKIDAIVRLNMGAHVLSQLLTLRHSSSPTSSMPPSSSTSTSSCNLQPLLLSILQPSSRHHPHQRSLVELNT